MPPRGEHTVSDFADEVYFFTKLWVYFRDYGINFSNKTVDILEILIFLRRETPAEYPHIHVPGGHFDLESMYID